MDERKERKQGILFARQTKEYFSFFCVVNSFLSAYLNVHINVGLGTDRSVTFISTLGEGFLCPVRQSRLMDDKSEAWLRFLPTERQ